METDGVKRFSRACVFCGSNSGNRKVFSDAALDLGNELVGACFLLSVHRFYVVFGLFLLSMPPVFFVLYEYGLVISFSAVYLCLLYLLTMS